MSLNGGTTKKKDQSAAARIGEWTAMFVVAALCFLVIALTVAGVREVIQFAF